MHKRTATTVTCDQCKRQTKIDLKERPQRGGGMERFFRCEHCKHHYAVAHITVEGVRIRQRMRVVEAELSLRPDDEALGSELVALRKRMREEVRGPE